MFKWGRSQTAWLTEEDKRDRQRPILSIESMIAHLHLKAKHFFRNGADTQSAARVHRVPYAFASWRELTILYTYR